MKITHAKLRQQEIKLPVIGKVSIDENGVTEVEDHIAIMMVENGGDEWQYYEETKKSSKKVTEIKQATVNGDEKLEDVMDIKKLSLEELNEIVDSFSLDTDKLCEFSKLAGIKGYHLFKTKPKILNNYVKKQLEKIKK